MADPNETVETETETETEAPETSSTSSTYESQLLMSMMADPEIQAVLNAKREGRAVRVSPADDDVPEGLESIENEMEGIDPDIQKVIGLLDKRISPLTKKIENLEALAANQERKTVDNQISSVEAKHSDFGKYRKDMAVIAREVQGLGVEELYILAKSRAGDLSMSESSTHTERPSPTPRSRLNKDKKDAPRRGRRGFQTTLADALAKLDD